MGPLMTLAHQNLRTIGVTTDKLEELVDIARASGAWGAKLTGAGGGGAVIAVAASPERYWSSEMSPNRYACKRR